MERRRFSKMVKEWSKTPFLFCGQQKRVTAFAVTL
jgi:hypothetical protein